MKQIITYVLLMICLPAFSNDNPFESGNEFYEAGKYEQAIELYGQIIGSGERSTEVYYNLGNAYYRNGELGKAIWAYESALKIDPDHEDAIFNLSFANAQTIDKIDIERRGFGHWFQSLIFSSNINLWAIISIVGSVLLSLFGMLFLSSRNRRSKNIHLLISSLATVIMIGSFIAAYTHKTQLIERQEGVVISAQIDVLVAPMEDANLSYKLSEGTKVELVSSQKEWFEINLNGNKGWIHKADLWEI